MRAHFVPLLLLAMLVALVRPGSAAPEEQLFPETGWRVGGRLLSFWGASGGLPVFGLPLGPAASTSTPEGAYVAQIFERERLELHPQLAAPYDVLLGRLGDELLRRQGRDWRAEGKGQQLPGSCRTFAQTSRTVCGAFLDYWRGHGLEFGDAGTSEREALALFGLPLTAPRTETNSSGDRVLTQWFERARFEHHPNNPAPYNVLLGRLGAEVSGITSIELPPVRLAIEPAAVPQGHTTTLAATIEQATAVRGTLGGVVVPLVRSGATWRAFLGLPPPAPPGRLPLRIEADLPDGRTVVEQAFVTVLNARYPAENINLPQEVRDLLARNQAAIQREREQVNTIWPQVTTERLWRGRFIQPAAGRLSSRFGTRRSYDGGPIDSFHEGLDIANVVGTPIVAAARGRVVFAQPDLLVRGGAVIVDHGQGVHTGYWHQSEVLVRVG